MNSTRVFLATAAFSALIGCNGENAKAPPQASGGGGGLDAIIEARGFTPDEAEAALKVFVPPGRQDEFLMFTSGGHRGSVLLYGLPSMRLLKEIPVYSPDAWQGWAQGEVESAEMLEKGSFGEWWRRCWPPC